MYVKTRILESLPGARPSPAAGGEAGGNDFRSAYGRAVDANAAADAPGNTLEPQKTVHVVRKGETLYGIARARLAATGAPANAESSMRYALQLARANNIRNPDRIQSGQKLELDAGGAELKRSSNPVAAGARMSGGGVAAVVYESAAATSSTDRGAMLDPHALAWQNQPPARDLFVEAEVSTIDIAVREPLMPVAPPLPAFAPIEPISEADSAAQLAVAARQIALYEQNAANAPDKAAAPPRGLPEILSKGVVGTVLDAVPIDPGTRTALQRANTIVSSAMTGRSLAAMTGFGGPILTIAGLLWGIFSSRQSEAVQTGETKPPADTKQTAQTAPPANVN